MCLVRVEVPPATKGSQRRKLAQPLTMKDAPQQSCRYHALRVQWSAPENCTFFVRGESGAEIIGSAEHVRNGTSYVSWVPCLLGGSYNVTIYRLSHAAANAAEIPDGAFVSMPLPNTTQWRKPWTPRSRFIIYVMVHIRRTAKGRPSMRCEQFTKKRTCASSRSISAALAAIRLT